MLETLSLDVVSLVAEYAREARWLFSFGAPGRSVDQLTFPLFVAVDGDGCIWVSDQKRLQVFTATGAFIRHVPIGASDSSSAWAPRGLAFDPACGSAAMDPIVSMRFRLMTPHDGGRFPASNPHIPSTCILLPQMSPTNAATVTTHGPRDTFRPDRRGVFGQTAIVCCCATTPQVLLIDPSDGGSVLSNHRTTVTLVDPWSCCVVSLQRQQRHQQRKVHRCPASTIAPDTDELYVSDCKAKTVCQAQA